jgi:anti-sigma regulatory factor (Ser/Thr protein kinase)
VADHVGADHVDDDMTCVVVRITDPDTSRERAIRRIELPCRISSLAALREFVGKACRELPGPPVEIDEVHRVVLAAHEAAANVVQHACSEFSETGLEAVVDRLDDRLAVRIYHQGIVPPAEALPDLDFDPGRDRGFGLFLIRHAVDEMHNERDTGGLGCVSLVKQVAAPRRGSTEKKEC